ncbi:hypothetical protein AMR42_13575 [Limnothrix sp. PR1529]|nr:hypothetical protein BCR12_08730 [Limnothrix sp. P13C2]PIB08503.1 hypothetical protein AMR42_13575 [Limnothrix sp. PR1529]
MVKTYINNAADLLKLCDLRASGTDDPLLLPGDRIELFVAMAIDRPQVAFFAFLEILKSDADSTYRALALRGLGQIVHPETLQEIQSCETEDTQELVQILASELLGKGPYSNDLTRWAAADAIINLKYPNSILRNTFFGGLTESPDRLQREITAQRLVQKDRVQRFDSQKQHTVEYERYLDFWTFGPAERLFSEAKLEPIDVSLLIGDLSWLGLELAFKASGAAVTATYAKFLDYCKRYCYQKEDNRLLLQSPRFFVDKISNSERINAIETIAKISNQKVSNQEEPTISFLKAQIKAATSSDIENWLETIENDLKSYAILETRLTEIIRFESLNQCVRQDLHRNQNIVRNEIILRMLSALHQASPLNNWTEADLLSSTDSDFSELIEDLKIRSDRYYKLKEDILAGLRHMFHNSTTDVQSSLQRLTVSFQSRRNSELSQLDLLKKTRDKLLSYNSQAEKTINVLLCAIDDLENLESSIAYNRMLNDDYIQAFVKTWTDPGMSYIAQDETLLSVTHELRQLSEVADDMSKHIQYEIDLIDKSIEKLEKSNPSNEEIKPFLVWTLMVVAFLFFTSFLAIVGVVVVIMPIIYVVIRIAIHFASLQWDKKIKNHENNRMYYQRLKDKIDYEASACKRLV